MGKVHQLGKLLSFGCALCKYEWVDVKWHLNACWRIVSMTSENMELDDDDGGAWLTGCTKDDGQYRYNNCIQQSFRIIASSIMVKLTIDTLFSNALYISQFFPSMYQNNIQIQKKKSHVLKNLLHCK